MTPQLPASAHPGKWLTLSQASRLIGVHSATLRLWADQGLIDSYQTPGKHRRFLEQDVQAFIELRRQKKGRRGLTALLDRAITRTQTGLQGAAQSNNWMVAFDDAARERQRELGRRLLGVMIQYLAREQHADLLLTEARSIGLEYGAHCFNAGLSLSETVRAFFFFRDSVTEAVVWLPESVGPARQEEMHFFRQVNEFLNHVHLAIVEAYETLQRDG